MLNIPEEFKTLYRNGIVPVSSKIPEKKLTLYFPELDLTIGNDRIVGDSFELQENLCSTEDITFGSCEGAILKLTIANLVQDLSGYEFVLKQTVEEKYEMPLGRYKIDSCKKKNDLWFREIVAFDNMSSTNIDVSDWYNSLAWPQTVKSMRESLINHLGLKCEEQTIINDNVILTKTINPSSLIGKDVLSRLCEINAGFGHFTRDDKFKVIQLSGLGLYPSESLYPAEDLFPSESGEYITSGYETTEYEEYIVEPITAVTIREDDEDTGTTAGTEGNAYIISGNFLLYGKSATEMQSIVENILLQVKNKYYRPHVTKMVGLPYMEVGDSVTIITNGDAVETFIFSRRMTGIQALRDEISATGNKKRTHSVSMNTQIQQLKSKTLKIVKSIDELSSTMVDMGEGLQSQITQTAGSLQTQITDNKSDLQSQITQTAGSLQTQITDNKNDLQSQITQTSSSLQSQITDNKSNADSSISQLADQISLKVTKGNLSAEISLENGDIRLSGNRLIVESSQFTLDENGKAWFGGEIAWGTGNYIKNDDNRNTIIKAVEALFLRAPAIGFGDLNKVQINGDTGSVTAQSISANGSSVLTISSGALKIHDHNINDLNGTLYSRNLGMSGGSISGQIAIGGGNAVGWDYAERTYAKSSDLRLKYDVQELDNIESFYMGLKPKKFRFKDGFDKHVVNTGLIAQQVLSNAERNEIETGMVYEADNVLNQGQYCAEGKHFNMKYDDLHAFHIKMIQGLKNENIQQAEELQNTKNELSELKALLLERGVI